MEQHAVSLPTLACLAATSALLAALTTYTLFSLHNKNQQLQGQAAGHGAGMQEEPHAAKQPPPAAARCGAPSTCSTTGSDTTTPAPDLAALQHRQPAMETKRADPYDPSPRSGYLQWDDYFMALAFLSAQRSKDPNKQVGAVIVDSNKVILSIGYNGFPRGCPDQALPWAKLAPAGTNNNPLATKYPYVVHAEANALLNKNTASISGASIYVTMFPCNECAKLLIQAGITEVIYHEEKVQEKVAGEAPGVTGQAPPQSRRTSDSGLLHNGSSQQGAEEVGDADADDANTGGMVRHSAAASNRHGKAQSNGTGCHNPEHSCRPGHELDNATADACYVASKRLLHMAGVRLRQHKLQRNVLLGPWSM